MFVNTHHTDEKFKKNLNSSTSKKRLFKADRVGGEHAKVIHRETEFQKQEVWENFQGEAFMNTVRNGVL